MPFEPKSFPPELITPVIEACDDPAVRMVMILCAFGGVRPGEALHLLDGDIIPGRDRASLFPGGASKLPVVVLADPVNAPVFVGDRKMRRVDYFDKVTFNSVHRRVVHFALPDGRTGILPQARFEY